MNAVDHLKKLIDIMQRCSPVWCDLNGLPSTDDEEWDIALGNAEDWIEDNA